MNPGDKSIKEEIINYEKKLQSFIAEAKKTSTRSFMAGILTAIIGIAALILSPLMNPCDDCEIKMKTIALSGMQEKMRGQVCQTLLNHYTR